MADNIIEKINNYLLESESYANEFLPLKETLAPIQKDFNNALVDLKQKADSSDDLADRVFYINRYTDLIKKMEGVFDTRSKRLQQILSMLTKLSPVLTENKTEDDENNNVSEKDSTALTPEQANEIIKILKNTEK